jgi:hypothetical protein
MYILEIISELNIAVKQGANVLQVGAHLLRRVHGTLAVPTNALRRHYVRLNPSLPTMALSHQLATAQGGLLYCISPYE